MATTEARAPTQTPPIWWASTLIVVFSMIFMMGSSTAYGVPVWVFMTSVADYISAFVLNLPFVLTVVALAFLATLVIALLLITAFYLAILLIAIVILVLAAPLLGAAIRILPGWLRFALVLLLYAALAYGIFLVWPLGWSWLSAQVVNGSGWLQKSGAMALNIVGALVGYPHLSVSYFELNNYPRGKEWQWAISGAFWIGYLFFAGWLGLRNAERVQERIRARVHEEMSDDEPSERRHNRVERVSRDYLDVLRAIRSNLPKLLVCLIPLVCVAAFGAGAVKGRLDRDQGARVLVQLENGETAGLMVASLERGVLLCDQACSQNRGPLRLYSWDQISRVDIMSSAMAPTVSAEPAAPAGAGSAPATTTAPPEVAAPPAAPATPAPEGETQPEGAAALVEERAALAAPQH